MKLIVKIIQDDLQLIAQKKALEQLGKIGTCLWSGDMDVPDLQKMASVEPDALTSKALLNQPQFSKAGSIQKNSDKR